MSGEKTGAEVFIKDKELAWIPARLLDQTGDKANVCVPSWNDEFEICQGGVGATSWKDKTISLKDYSEFEKQLPLQNTRILDDMVDLPYLHEAAILFNIKARLGDGLPYTRTGDIVIAVNPYTWLTHLYEEKSQLEYANVLVWQKHDVDARKFVAPHVYEISSLCYKGLAVGKVNQSILVSGESGAGKTETVKICMNHMASLQRGPVKATGEAYTSAVVQRVVDSNPILEAFGNAKTRRNDNSSRFGKYIMLQFARQPPMPGTDVDTCGLAGSKANVYLLEKSRIVGHDEVEGAYHIFYQILNSEDPQKTRVWSGLKGAKCEDYKYVGKLLFERKIDGMTDAENFDHLCKSLDMVYVKDEKFHTLFSAIAAVLVLGNIVFQEVAGSDGEKSEIKNKDVMKAMDEILGIKPDALELMFIERTMKTRNEEYKVPLKTDQAKEGCNAFAKEIYSRAFLWLVREINSATSAEENYEGGGKTDFGLIGLLDIFGFESFPVNGFEQLCINYCNEKLQQKFTKDIFQSVQEEYKAEGIDLDDITYDDNSDVLQLIEKRGGLLAMLNEECVRPSGNDAAFVSKAISGNKKSPALIADMKMGPLEFGIHHYAGKVAYNGAGFVGRNTDTLPVDLQVGAKTSSNEIVALHLDNDAMTKTESAAAESGDGKGPPKRGKSGLVGDTVWTKFKTQLTSLMTGLGLTSSRYIRCVKPNKVKKALKMQHTTTMDQLRCAGVVAAVTISRSAYPNKLDHVQCLQRFKMMKEDGVKIDENDPIPSLEALLEPVLKCKEKDGKKVYVCGKTKIYFRMGALEYIENERSKHLGKWAIKISKLVKGYLIRKGLGSLRMKSKAPNALRIQQWFRCLVAKKEIKKRSKKKKGAAKKKKKQVKAAIRLQAIARGFIVRPQFQKMMEEKKEKDKLKNEVKDMESKLKEAEKAREEEVRAAQEAAEKEIAEYKAMIEAERKADKEKQKKNNQQQTLIDESGKIIEYLRKENMKLRNQNDQMRKDFKSLKENNARLMEANASASASFNALNDHAKQLNATNAKLIKNVEAYKQQLEKLKEDLKTRQSYYLAEAEARLAYQKTMASIVGTIQDKCRDAQLTEDVVIMALECEAEAKSERAALDSAPKKSAAAAAPAAPAASSSKKKPVKKKQPEPESDSDDDDDDDDSDSDSD